MKERKKKDSVRIAEVKKSVNPAQQGNPVGFYLLAGLIILLAVLLKNGTLIVADNEQAKDVVAERIEENVVEEIAPHVSYNEDVDPQDHLDLENEIANLPVEELSEEEIAGLLQMREEEKLAHDVYTALYEVWGQNIFNNIAKSEQTHTDSVADLLEKYDIEDPVKTDTIGVFEDEGMTELYDTLVAKGEESLVDALIVGAIVEDLDIYDLRVLMAATDNEDILTIYQNLEKGSRNHMRAFTRLLNRNGAEYEAQYISDAEYVAIITSASENGIVHNSLGKELEN